MRRGGVDATHERVGRDAGMPVRKKRRKRMNSTSRPDRNAATKPNTRWSADFASDSLFEARRLRVPNVVEGASPRAVTLELEPPLPTQCGAPALDQAAELLGGPCHSVIDNGPACAGSRFEAWC